MGRVIMGRFCDHFKDTFRSLNHDLFSVLDIDALRGLIGQTTTLEIVVTVVAPVEDMGGVNARRHLPFLNGLEVLPSLGSHVALLGADRNVERRLGIGIVSGTVGKERAAEADGYLLRVFAERVNCLDGI